jgi:hypothetical protein
MREGEGGSPVVGQWERFEVSLDNGKDYADPYRDVALPAEFRRPDGSVVAFWGFYDGAATWRLRFMPDQQGVWTYTARFSDGSGGAEGEFLCTRSVIPGMLATYAENPVWFGYRGGGPLLVRSFHVGDRFFAANFAEASRREFLDWIEAQGYTMLSMASHYLNRDAPGRGAGWDTPRLWPLDAGEFGKLERILDELAARHLMVFPFAGFFGRSSNAPGCPDDQALYVRYVLARLGAYWHILLNVGGPEPTLPHSPYMTSAEVDRLGSLIASQNVFDHPLTVHNPTGDDAFMDADWLDFTTLQGPKTTDLDVLSEGVLRNHSPHKPLYAQETLWSGNKYHPDYSDAALRRNAYVLLMSAAAINFADNGGPEGGSVGDSSSGFSGTLDPRDARQGRHDILKRVWDCIETMPYHRMVPRQDLVDRGFCLCEAGRAYLVYLPEGGAVDVAVVPGSYAVEWINARHPADRRDGGITTDGQALAAPRDREIPGEDWLVYLHSRDNYVR